MSIKNNLQYNILKGSDKQVNKILKEYNDGIKPILLLNATYFGAGMNLQMTDQIIMYHRFSKEMEEQIIGRAQRFGRETQLKVVYLIHCNETTYTPDLFDFNEMSYQHYLETIKT
jgi:SNF2 family DNA or RNA helicase